MRLLFDGLLTLLFPPRCEVCGQLQEPVLCTGCLSAFTLVDEPYCRQCGLPFDPQAKTDGHCLECREDPPPFDAARAAGVYGGGLRRAVHHFKYDGVRALATPLGRLIAEHVTLPFPLQVLCPVPLHPRRERMRGYNQSALLAEALGTHWALPVEAELLTRVRETAPQMTLPRDERRRNVRGAFAAAGDVAGRAVGLVDDVFTTGATLRECARALKRAGASRVLVLTVARTVPDLP